MRRRSPRGMPPRPPPSPPLFLSPRRCSLQLSLQQQEDFSYYTHRSPAAYTNIILKPFLEDLAAAALLFSVDHHGRLLVVSIIHQNGIVHHLIEKCICFNLNKEECMEALQKHANINPVITSTVWKELEKENKEFFERYNKDREERNIEAETMQRIQKMLAEAAASKTDDDDGEG
ncbi:hypothetical protein ACP4OV_028826 [Aristida adscensionis]